MASKAPTAISNDDRRAFQAAKAAGDKAGMEAVKAAVRRRQASLERSLANIESDKEGYRPTAGMSNFQKFRAGFGGGMVNVGRQAAALLTPEALEGKSFDRAARDEQLQTDADLNSTGAGATGKFVGEMVATAPVGGFAGGAVRGLGATAKGLHNARKALSATRRLGSYAAEGAVGGSLVGDDQEGQGAVAGAILSPVLNRGGRLIKALSTGMGRTKSAARAMQHGADLSPGKMNPDSLLGRIERTATASPILGGKVKQQADEGLRDVVPNRMADIRGEARVPGEGLQGGAKRFANRTSQLYGPASRVPVPAMAGHVRQSFLTTAMRSLDNNVAARDAPIAKELEIVLNRLQRANKAGDVQDVLSSLKGLKRDLKYGPQKDVPSSSQSADVYEDVIQWVDKYHKRLLQRHGPANNRLADDVAEGNRVVAGTKPFESASVKAQAQKRSTPKGTAILSELRDNMTPGQFARGEGGMNRRVADAMADLQTPRTGGVIERFPLLRSALGLAVMPAAGVAGSKFGRQVAQGNLQSQKAVRRWLRTKQGRQFQKMLPKARAGAVGATVSDVEDTEE